MPRWFKIASLLLLAIWLPATLHCRLEAAGLTAAHEDRCDDGGAGGTATGCRDDSCPTVEEALLKDSSSAVTVPAPTACDCALGLAAPAGRSDEPVEPLLSPLRYAPPSELSARWQFDYRAAPPARAPALNLARA